LIEAKGFVLEIPPGIGRQESGVRSQKCHGDGSFRVKNEELSKQSCLGMAGRASKNLRKGIENKKDIHG
jgi:hypothetical protein